MGLYFIINHTAKAQVEWDDLSNAVHANEIVRDQTEFISKNDV